jgi:hypothetical protein
MGPPVRFSGKHLGAGRPAPQDYGQPTIGEDQFAFESVRKLAFVDGRPRRFLRDRFSVGPSR